MTITLYQDKDWKGRRMAVTGNHRSLKDTDLGNSPSSIIMDAPADAILTFGREDWKGGVMYFRGVRRMASLGDLSAGGELFKGNSVTSVRVTPFVLELNVSVVTRNEKMPGDHEDMDHVGATFTKAMLLANAFFEREKAMIRLAVARLSNRENPEKYDLAGAEAARFPADWKKPGEVDVILCNTVAGAHGQAKFPWWGKVMIVALADRSISQVARTLAHELGHYLGLTHASGAGQAANLMTPSDLGLPIDDTTLTPAQIEEMHKKLATNITRKGDRAD